MSNAIRCTDRSFAVKNSGTSCLWAQIFNLSNLRLTILDAKNRFKVARYDTSYAVSCCRLIQIHGLVVKTNTSDNGEMGSIPVGC